MLKKLKKAEIVYKEQITNLFLLLLEIAGHEVQKSKKFDEDYRKRLKFQKQTDWKKYRASVDLLNDTEYAIQSAFEYQLGDISNLNYDYGETYLRLYGILNAVYLQMHAYKEIANLLNFPERATIMERFEELDIYRLRNIAGAHTIDYLYDKKERKNTALEKSSSFRITQFHLEKTGKKIQVMDENNNQSEYNLLEILNEYEIISRDLLLKLIKHMISKLILKKEDKTETISRLNEMLPNLINYNAIDKNKEYTKAKREEIKKSLDK